MHCPMCGKEIEEGQKICPYCGTPLGGPELFDEDEEWQQSEFERAGNYKNARFEGSDFEKNVAPTGALGNGRRRSVLPMLLAVLVVIALAVVLWKMRR